MPDYNKKAASMQRWPFCFHCLVRVSVDTFPKVVMKNESEPRAWRSQRDHGLPVKLAVVGEVGRGEWSCKQAQRRYATHCVTFQAGGLAFRHCLARHGPDFNPGAAHPPVRCEPASPLPAPPVPGGCGPCAHKLPRLGTRKLRQRIAISLKTDSARLVRLVARAAWASLGGRGRLPNHRLGNG